MHIIASSIQCPCQQGQGQVAMFTSRVKPISLANASQENWYPVFRIFNGQPQQLHINASRPSTAFNSEQYQRKMPAWQVACQQQHVYKRHPPSEPERPRISVKQKGYSLDERSNAKAKVEKPSALPLSKAISGWTVAADERSSEPRGVPVSRHHPHAPPLSCSLAHSHSLFWCTPLPSNR